MISKTTIDQVYDTARVEEVIGDFVQLKKSGSNYKGLSPFTEERTPSFMVSPVKQIWKDFSSGKGGNAVAFLMEHEHFTYPEAIRYLAKKYAIEIEETEQSDEQKAQANERESMYLISDYAQGYFSNILWESQPGKAIGHSYFKERGFTDATIKKFSLGYSLDEWEAFTKTALENGYKLEFLEKTGLTIVKEQGAGQKKTFDRFKGRVMFPIHSMSGRVLGFGGRILANDKKAAKYLNSPESEIYHKSKVLYGIYHAKQAIAKEDNCYLVEGYTDVIQMHQRGIENVVASSGTALTSEQIRLINRLTKNITVLFDGDAAGLRASLRGIDLILEQDMNVKVCTFPEGDDPDSFAKNNAFEDVVLYLEANAKDFIQFKTSLLIAESANDPLKRAETIRDIVGSIAKIPDRIKQEIYVQECAKLLQVSEATLYGTLAQLNKKEVQEARKRAKQEQKAFEVVKTEAVAEKVDIYGEHEKEVLKILLEFGKQTAAFDELYYDKEKEEEILEQVERIVAEKIYLELQEDEIEFSNQDFKALYSLLINALVQADDFQFSDFANSCPQHLSAILADLDSTENRYELHDWNRRQIYPKPRESDLVMRVQHVIVSLRLKLINDLVEGLMKNASEAENTGDILQEVRDYNELKVKLAKRNNLILKDFGGR